VNSSPVPDPRLQRLLDQLKAAAGSADPASSTDGWRLVLAENIAYLVDDERRWQAVAKLEVLVGIAPESILAAQHAALRGIVIGMSPDQRVARLRRCAELAIEGAPWTAYPGIGRRRRPRATSCPPQRQPLFAHTSCCVVTAARSARAMVSPMLPIIRHRPSPGRQPDGIRPAQTSPPEPVHLPGRPGAARGRETGGLPLDPLSVP
jgi:hypothetical protein